MAGAGERAEDAHYFKSVADYIHLNPARAGLAGGGIEEKSMAAIRSGWYLGEASFKDKLLGLIDKAGGKLRKRGSVAGAAVRAHGESEAERIIRSVGAELGLPESAEELGLLRKGDPRKVICAALVKGRTSMKNDWLAKRLCMGHPAAMSQLVSRIFKDSKSLRILKKHEETFNSKDSVY